MKILIAAYLATSVWLVLKCRMEGRGGLYAIGLALVGPALMVLVLAAYAVLGRKKMEQFLAQLKERK